MLWVPGEGGKWGSGATTFETWIGALDFTITRTRGSGSSSLLFTALVASDTNTGCSSHHWYGRGVRTARG